MTSAVYGFPEDRGAAIRLADVLGVPFHPVHPHTFPDGESRPTVSGGAQGALLYRNLSRPDAKLVPTLLAADALRRAGSGHVTLVAPYLPYLRQDDVFEPGQPLSRDVLARLLAPAFDRIVTVEPHLHRTRALSRLFAATQVTALSVAPLFARAIRRSPAPIIVGPDIEASSLVAELADLLCADRLVCEKQRFGDAAVRLALPQGASVAGRRVAVVDDICASGATLRAVLTLLRDQGAAGAEVFVAHALFSSETGDALYAAGAERIVSTDSCNHWSSELLLCGLLANALPVEVAA